jgi:hypothetical protein
VIAAARSSALTLQSLAGRPVICGRETPATLFVVVDTEEEFDWSAPFSRASTSVTAMRSLGRGQAVFAEYGVVPTYVADYAVVTQPDGYLPLLDYWRDGACGVGAHLHPWITPPLSERVCAENSYGCNLPPDLERAKIERLSEAIAERFGVPTIFKAGRYGFGASTAASLEQLGFAVDLSINPTLPLSADGGPSFEAFDSRPFFFGRCSLLELPCTGEYVGWAGPLKRSLHRLGSSAPGRSVHAVGILARMGIVNRIMLSPEVSNLQEMIALTRALYADGLRQFSLTFHSPSLEPGHTPYVRSSADLGQFLDRIRAYCSFFFGQLGGVTSTPAQFRAAQLSQAATTS